jgi:hypothetical protein
MNKKYFFLVLIVLPFLTWGEAPELKNVLPNSWRKLVRLSNAEKNQAIRNYKWERIDIEYGHTNYSDIFVKLHGHIIFKQIASGKIFYHVFGKTNEREVNFNESVNFNKVDDDYYQLVYLYEDGLCKFVSGRNHFVRGSEIEIGDYVILNNIDVIERKDGLIAIMNTSISPPATRKDQNVDWEFSAEIDFSRKVKGQVYGDSYVEYQLLDDYFYARSGRAGDRFTVIPDFYKRIYVKVKNCLIDPVVPFNYTAQNLFDNDLSTSVVENTENDNLEIRIYFPTGRNYPFFVTGISIVNGYAKSPELYSDNNRVKTIKVTRDLSKSSMGSSWSIYDGYTSTFNLEDNKLESQNISLNAAYTKFTQELNLTTSAFYSGKKYNDTCIAELNINTDIYGWLF